MVEDNEKWLDFIEPDETPPHLPDCQYGGSVPIALCCLPRVAFEAGQASAVDCTEEMGELRQIIRHMHTGNPEAWNKAQSYFDKKGWSMGVQFGKD